MISTSNPGSLPTYDERKYEHTLVVPAYSNRTVDHELTDVSRITLVLQTAGATRITASRNPDGDHDAMELIPEVFASPAKSDLPGNSDFLVLTNGSGNDVEVKVIVVV